MTRGIFQGRCALCGYPARNGYCYEHAWARGTAVSSKVGRRATSATAGKPRETRRPDAPALELASASRPTKRGA